MPSLKGGLGFVTKADPWITWKVSEGVTSKGLRTPLESVMRSRKPSIEILRLLNLSQVRPLILDNAAKDIATRRLFQKSLLASPNRIGSSSKYGSLVASVLPYVSRTASFNRTKSLLKLLQTPKFLSIIKESLGVSSLSEVPSRLKSLAATAKKYLRDLLTQWKSSFPMSLYFDGKQKMPSLTDLLNRIVSKSPRMKSLLESVKSGVNVLDSFLAKHLPTLGKPLLAAIYIYVWLNVTELSWDIESVVKGFTGRISLVELFASLPESGIGALVGLTGVGTFYFVPITIIARIVWLVGKNYLEWTGSGFVIRWDRMGIGNDTETVRI